MTGDCVLILNEESAAWLESNVSYVVLKNLASLFRVRLGLTSSKT